MNVYILGICGTFMAGLALLARELGYQVRGSDARVYPPMSTQLAEAGIELQEGYDAESLPDDCDVYIIGNAISRGNPQFEALLEQGLFYTSGPQWLYEAVLRQRWVLAVAGTHGKTTTSSMLAWILEQNGLQPGYLIGGVGHNFTTSARLGRDPFFVIEADEYDSALFDKRSKFVHYHPRTLVLNNLEFDHADIFDDLAAIQKQFHHLVRSLPASAQIIVNDDEPALDEVLAMGCWSERLGFSLRSGVSDFLLDSDGRLQQTGGHESCQLELAQAGQYNYLNATAAALAARHAGVPLAHSAEALAKFEGVRRRQEIIAEINGVRIIDDFAHHPTAIELTLEALRSTTEGRLIAVLDIRSNTMRMGVHADRLAESLSEADLALMVENPDLSWDIHQMAETAPTIVSVQPDTRQIIEYLVQNCQRGDQVVIMSNGGFDNIHRRLVEALQS